MLAASDENGKEICMEAFGEEKRKVKRCIYLGKKKVNEQFGRNMNEDENGNMKLVLMEVINVKGGKVESCRRIKDRNGTPEC